MRGDSPGATADAVAVASALDSRLTTCQTAGVSIPSKGDSMSDTPKGSLVITDYGDATVFVAPNPDRAKPDRVRLGFGHTSVYFTVADARVVGEQLVAVASEVEA